MVFTPGPSCTVVANILPIFLRYPYDEAMLHGMQKVVGIEVYNIMKVDEIVFHPDLRKATIKGRVIGADASVESVDQLFQLIGELFSDWTTKTQITIEPISHVVDVGMNLEVEGTGPGKVGETTVPTNASQIYSISRSRGTKDLTFELGPYPILSGCENPAVGFRSGYLVQETVNCTDEFVTILPPYKPIYVYNRTIDANRNLIIPADNWQYALPFLPREESYFLIQGIVTYRVPMPPSGDEMELSEFRTFVPTDINIDGGFSVEPLTSWGSVEFTYDASNIDICFDEYVGELYVKFVDPKFEPKTYGEPPSVLQAIIYDDIDFIDDYELDPENDEVGCNSEDFWGVFAYDPSIQELVSLPCDGNKLTEWNLPMQQRLELIIDVDETKACHPFAYIDSIYNVYREDGEPPPEVHISPPSCVEIDSPQSSPVHVIVEGRTRGIIRIYNYDPYNYRGFYFAKGLQENCVYFHYGTLRSHITEYFQPSEGFPVNNSWWKFPKNMSGLEFSELVLEQGEYAYLNAMWVTGDSDSTYHSLGETVVFDTVSGYDETEGYDIPFIHEIGVRLWKLKDINQDIADWLYYQTYYGYSPPPEGVELVWEKVLYHSTQATMAANVVFGHPLVRHEGLLFTPPNNLIILHT